jgi:hypothetical protein
MTTHFTLEEFVRSQTAERLKLHNLPSKEIIEKLHFTMAGMERIRALLGVPIKVNSGYRSEELNRAVKGSKNSQHMKGEACDFVCPAFGTPLEVCVHLWPNIKILGIDQLIYENTWIHVSFTLNPRHEVYTLKQGKYLLGIIS